MDAELFVAVRAGDRERVREILKQHPGCATARDAGGATALHYAAENGDSDIALLLLDAGADINARDARFGATPAGWAIEYLRQRGAVLGIEIEDARYAITKGDTQLLQRYLARFPSLAPLLGADNAELRSQLSALGVRPGGVLLVHTAFSKVAPVEGGPLGLIAALRDAVGAEGTVAMPSMSDDDEHPFDAKRTPCKGMGIVAETFWKLPGVLRSDSPHAFAAIGPRAAEITAPHPLDVPHGLDSPVGRIYELDGQVLLLGVGHDANTTVHLAESIAGVRYRRPKFLMIMRDGRPARFDYNEIDHCTRNFNLMDAWLGDLQRRGTVGRAEARLVKSRAVVETAVRHLRDNPTAFLHPIGVDHECDEARASL